MAIMLLAFVVYALNVQTSYTYQQEMFVAKNRVQAMDTFLEDLDRDMSRAVYIIGFRVLLAMQQEIVSQGVFINDVDAIFNEGFLDGRIFGDPHILLNQSTYINWTQRMEVEASKLKLNLSIHIDHVRIYQAEPWSVRVEVTSNINLTDDLQTAEWNMQKTTSGDISILDFEDPLYIVNSLGKVTNIITRSPYEGDFVSFGSTKFLRNHINGSYYVANPVAPDYLQRLTGNITGNSTNGIESLVYVPTFYDAGFDPLDRSAVDYIYFGTVDLSDQTFKINNTYTSWFRLDNTSGHLERYMVENITLS